MSNALLQRTESRIAWNDRSNTTEVDGKEYRIHAHGGGLVALTATVGPDVFVGPHAVIREYAIVVGLARLFDDSVVEGHAVVADYCTLRDHARVSQNAVLRGSVNMAGAAHADGTACVSGGVQLCHFAHISGGIYTGGMSIS